MFILLVVHDAGITFVSIHFSIVDCAMPFLSHLNNPLSSLNRQSTMSMSSLLVNLLLSGTTQSGSKVWCITTRMVGLASVQKVKQENDKRLMRKLHIHVTRGYKYHTLNVNQIYNN